jgi:glycosyltransferase involved in cell wall biosynthesis
MLKTDKRIFIAVPAMNEMDWLPEFINCLRQQSFKHFKVVVGVNQPDDWWNNKEKDSICENNQKSIEYLKSIQDMELEIIDKSSRGKGWTGKKTGVGWARKTTMDKIAKEAKDTDILLCLDADTTFHTGYLQSILDTFSKNPEAVALSVPYYHKLTGNREADRAILRYEIYMRYYVLNLWRIKSPYNFTAIGSAMALPVKAYKSIGGITPHKSGEDFYFLQKLRKYGEVLTWNEEKVYPAARFSDRVGFGTGPAMIKGNSGDWNSYPVYPCEYFDEVKATYDLFPLLFEGNVSTPMDEFHLDKFGGKDIWKPLRENFKKKDKFVRACHHKVDAFRVLQYLKWRSDGEQSNDEKNLYVWFDKFYPEHLKEFSFDLVNFKFDMSSIEELNQLRDKLVLLEEQFQKSEN